MALGLLMLIAKSSSRLLPGAGRAMRWSGPAAAARRRRLRGLASGSVASSESPSSSPESEPAGSSPDEGGAGSSSASGGGAGKGWGLFPEDVVAHLGRFVIGQEEAKKATAIALRTRWRRMQLPADYRQEVPPSNILMKGPTGSGKTEIARRLAALSEAPFVKVEATRYTEVGIVGANTSSMIKELMDNAVALQREAARKRVEAQARDKAEARVLELLRRPNTEENREALRQGQLDHLTVKMPPREPRPGGSGGPSSLRDLLDLGDMDSLAQGPFMGGAGGPVGVATITLGPGGARRGTRGGGNDKQTLSVKAALERLVEELSADMTNEDDIIDKARQMAEEFGIVVIDEIDKLAGNTQDAVGGGKRLASDAKGEGVQRELLTLVEGCQVATRYGPIKTDHILFIAAGAFHRMAPSDLLPELQGRFPVRVVLKPLTKSDLIQIVAFKAFNLVEQTVRLMATEGLQLAFTPCGIEEIASVAEQINRVNQDIGARRLHTVMSRVMEEVSFSAPRLRGQRVVVDAEYVRERLKGFDPMKKEALDKYIL